MDDPAMTRCACGDFATANDRECGACFRDRLLSVNNGFAPSRSVGSGQMDRDATRRYESRLADFSATAAEGSVPRAVSRAAISEARRISDRTGEAFRADAAAMRMDGNA